jgi:predicted nucleic-acid-binding protein
MVTGPPVLFELAWTLRAAYKGPPARVLELLSAVFATPGLTLTDAPIVAAALPLALATGSEFADAYGAAIGRAAGFAGVATYNRKDFEQGVNVACL